MAERARGGRARSQWSERDKSCQDRAGEFASHPSCDVYSHRLSYASVEELHKLMLAAQLSVVEQSSRLVFRPSVAPLSFCCPQFIIQLDVDRNKKTDRETEDSRERAYAQKSDPGL